MISKLIKTVKYHDSFTYARKINFRQNSCFASFNLLKILCIGLKDWIKHIAGITKKTGFKYSETIDTAL